MDQDTENMMQEMRAQNVLLIQQLEAARGRIKALEDEVTILSKIVAERLPEVAPKTPQPSGFLGTLFRGKR